MPGASNLQISRKRQLLVAREEIRNLRDPIIVLLDDDLTFDNLMIKEDNITSGYPFSYIHEIHCIHRKFPSLDVGLGGVTGAPPLPSSSSFFVGLLDASSRIEAQNKSNLRWKNPDYYYDFSELRQGWESWIEPTWDLSENSDNLSVSDKILHSFLFSGPIRRPLVLIEDPIDNCLTEGYIRGGNTVVFSPIWLNILEHPDIDRRADSIWSLTIRHLGGKVMHMPYPLRHRREFSQHNVETNSIKLQKTYMNRHHPRHQVHSRMLADLIGSSLQRTYAQKGDFQLFISILKERQQVQSDILKNCEKLMDSVEKSSVKKTNKHGEYSFWALSIKERVELLNGIRTILPELPTSSTYYRDKKLLNLFQATDSYLIRSELNYKKRGD